MWWGSEWFQISGSERKKERERERAGAGQLVPQSATRRAAAVSSVSPRRSRLCLCVIDICDLNLFVKAFQ